MPFAWSRKPVPSIFDWTSDLRSYTKDGSLLDIHSLPPPPTFMLHNEHGDRIDTTTSEYPEQCLVHNFLNPNSIVLELGARYGSVSCVINKLLNNPRNQVSVEPDSTVWSALEQNLEINECSPNVYKGFVSKKKLGLTQMGYASMAVETNSTTIPSKSVKELETEFGLHFTALVADCEGFLETFFNENPFLYTQLHTVLFEADFPNKCDYTTIRTTLKAHGFVEHIHGFQNVYIKQNEVLFDTRDRSPEETVYGESV